jgi:PPOX class probable F420-dependent enzyme
MQLDREIVERLLERWPVARLVTLGRDGRPHVVPIVFARHGGHLWSPVDAKPKAARELARVRNVRTRPEVSVLLDHYDADWTMLWWLRVDGRASAVEAGDPSLQGSLELVASALRAKYPQYASVQLFRGKPLLLRIAIEQMRSWCAGPEAARAASEGVLER